MKNTQKQKKDIPFFLDHAVELPKSVVIESNSMGQDCVTVNPPSGCDDD